jgi:hypothetical protein
VAAVVAIIGFCRHLLGEADIVHYIDNKPALSCIIKGFSKQDDLCNLTGMLWYEAGKLMSHYRAEYVESKLNLADGPSRDDMSTVESIAATEVPLTFPDHRGGLHMWMSRTSDVRRLIL